MLLDERVTASFEVAAPTIKEMFQDAFGISNPRHFQVYGIYLLAYLHQRVLAVQATGSGKSLLILGAVTMMRNIAIVIEPLLAVGADQARAANEMASAAASEKGEDPDLVAFHLDGLSSLAKKRVIQLLLAMTSSYDGPALVLYLSPQALLPGPWVDVFVHLIAEGLVSIAAVDEIHKVVSDGRFFRREFAELRTTFWGLLGNSPRPVAELSMTATLTPSSRSAYEKMMGRGDFHECLHGNTSRRDIDLYFEVHTNPTIPIKTVAQRHLLVADRKVVIFTNSAAAANGPLKKSLTTLLSSTPGITGDVATLSGDSGTIVKEYVINGLSSTTPTPNLDLRVSIMTAAGECGWSSPFLGAALEHGLPESIVTYAQHVGRVGRKALLHQHSIYPLN
jgi:superfamily II DNA helicase RecQ